MQHPMSESDKQGAAGQPPAAEAQAPARADEQPVPSEALLQGRSCVMIRHGDAVYALRATRAGKLILTK